MLKIKVGMRFFSKPTNGDFIILSLNNKDATIKYSKDSRIYVYPLFLIDYFIKSHIFIFLKDKKVQIVGIAKFVETYYKK